MKQFPYAVCPLCILCNIHALFSRKEQKMKNKKTSKILILLMIVTLLIPAFGSAAYAKSDTDNSIAPMTAAVIRYSFDATSNVKGDAYVYASCTGIATFITSKITLQSAPLGSASFTNVSGVLPSIQTVYDRSNITHLCSFPISTSKNYRIKIEITDKVNGKQATVTKYKTLTR